MCEQEDAEEESLIPSELVMEDAVMTHIISPVEAKLTVLTVNHILWTMPVDVSLDVAPCLQSLIAVWTECVGQLMLIDLPVVDYFLSYAAVVLDVSFKQFLCLLVDESKLVHCTAVLLATELILVGRLKLHTHGTEVVLTFLALPAIPQVVSTLKAKHSGQSLRDVVSTSCVFLS